MLGEARDREAHKFSTGRDNESDFFFFFYHESTYFSLHFCILDHISAFWENRGYVL